MADILDVGISGLRAHQAALTVTGHNITNAGTEGYNRQEVNFTENHPQFINGYWSGSGVNVDSVRRVHDEFMTEQLRRDTSAFQQFNTLAKNASQIDSLLADAGTGIQPGLKRMFGALQASVDDPSSLPAREVLISESQGLADRFSSISDRLMEQNSVINGQMEVMAGQITTMAESIAELNEQIQFATAGAQGIEPNDLLNQRDKLLKDLSKLVEVNVVQQDNAGLNVFIGNGQALVVGNDFNKVFTSSGEKDPSRKDIFFRKGDVIQNITRELKGGELGGTLDFRAQVLDPTLNGLGRTALVINQTFNEQHKLGIDYNGLKGESFFTGVNEPQKTYSRVFGDANNADPDDRIVSVHITDSGSLTTSDYRLDFPGPDDQTFRITRINDNKVLTTQSLTGEMPQKVEIDGFEVRLESGTFQRGDQFLLMPTRMGSTQVKMNVTRAEQVALASPIATNTAIGNRGSATISAGTVYDTNTSYLKNEGKLDPPVLIRFTSPTRYDVLDNSDPGRPIPLFPPLMNQTYTPGITNSILPENLGKTAFTSFGGVLPNTATYQAPGTHVNATNGFFPERIIISHRDPVTGQKTQQPTLITRENASAKEIASELSKRDGIKATARTTVQLSDFNEQSNGFLPLSVTLNGIELTDTLGPNQTKYDANYPEKVPNPMTPDFIADRINANRDFQGQGIVARSDGKTITVIALHGEDLSFEIAGDHDDGFSVSNGQNIKLQATGENPFTLLNNVDGYDFSAGGPYTYEFDVPGQGTFAIQLTENYTNGTDLIAGIRTQIENTGIVLPGNLDVKITEKGNIQFQNRLDVRATGANGSTKIAMGGQIKVVTDANYRIEVEPPGNNLFPAKPIAEPVHFGFHVNITGLVKSGDEFTIGFNKNGTSDSRNGAALTSLQTKKVVAGNTNYSESYARLVENIGSVTSRAKINKESSEVLLRNTANNVSSISGVNLDEEASKLIEYELAYNASAQVIQVARDIFDTLIGTFR